MLVSTILSLFLVCWSALFLCDYILRNCQVEWYYNFTERHGLVIAPFQIKFYWTRFESQRYYAPFLNFQTWAASSYWSRPIAIWFTIGTLITLVFFFLTPIYLCWLLFTEIFNWISIIQWLNTGPTSSFLSVRVNNDGLYEHSDLGTPPLNTISYVPFQQHVQTGLIPVIPGVNIPASHLPMFILVLVISGVAHELGHALAANFANVRLNGFGFFFLAIYAGAFTELDTEELNRASLAQRLRIYSAGILHNIVLGLIGILILWTIPMLLFPLFASGHGVMVKDVEQRSGLFGGTGFRPGFIITGVNRCEVKNTHTWAKCLEEIRLNGNTGYLMKRSDVLPMVATPSFVKQYGDEIQCCEGFSNLTFSSHICFNYISPDTPQREAADKGLSLTTPAAKIREALGIKPRNVTAVEWIGRRGRKIRDLNKEVPVEAPGPAPRQPLSYACLSARWVTSQPKCKIGDTMLNDESVCVVPSLYNGTQLINFEVANKNEVVLFVGPVTEPMFMVRVSEVLPRFNWVPLWIPDLIELFAQYLVTFSFALGVLNALPCYGLDGQFICHTVVEYFCSQRKAAVRNRIAGAIILFGTTIFLLNLAVGFVKLFLYFTNV